MDNLSLRKRGRYRTRHRLLPLVCRQGTGGTAVPLGMSPADGRICCPCPHARTQYYYITYGIDCIYASSNDNEAGSVAGMRAPDLSRASGTRLPRIFAPNLAADRSKIAPRETCPAR